MQEEYNGNEVYQNLACKFLWHRIELCFDNNINVAVSCHKWLRLRQIYSAVHLMLSRNSVDFTKPDGL